MNRTENMRRIAESRKDKTYEEIYGIEMAKEIKVKQGNSHKGLCASEETKKKMSNSRQGEKNPFYRKKHTLESKRKIGKSKLGKQSWNIGLTKETDERVKKGAINTSITKKKMFKEGKLPSFIGATNEDNPTRRFEVREKISKTRIDRGVAKLDRNSSWLGGISFLPYTKEFNKLFKELIRQRDNFSCLKCNLFQDDHLKLYKRKLICHHIDYNKQLTIPENCCTLCIRCNVEINANRPHWTKFFQSLLAERYGYKYSEDGKIILKLNSMEVK